MKDQRKLDMDGPGPCCVVVPKESVILLGKLRLFPVPWCMACCVGKESPPGLPEQGAGKHCSGNVGTKTCGALAGGHHGNR